MTSEQEKEPCIVFVEDESNQGSFIRVPDGDSRIEEKDPWPYTCIHNG